VEDENTGSATFTSTTGGVMTDEAGAITGELEVETRVEDGGVAVRARYAGADEWYAVTGSPVTIGEGSTCDVRALHERIVAHLRRPGPMVDGNEEAVSWWGSPREWRLLKSFHLAARFLQGDRAGSLPAAPQPG
jgi:hypothetical protein